MAIGKPKKCDQLIEEISALKTELNKERSRSRLLRMRIEKLLERIKELKKE